MNVDSAATSPAEPPLADPPARLARGPITTPYTIIALLGVVQIALWWGVLFGAAPRLLFAGAPRCPVSRHLFDDVVRMSLVGMAVVHVLVALRLFDVFSLMAGLLLVAVARARLVRGIRVVPALRSHWSWLAARLLDVLDRGDEAGTQERPRTRALLGAVGARLSGRVPRPWLALLVLVFGGSAWLRLSDAVRHPASDLPDYLAHLSLLNALGSNDLYRDGVYPHGAEALLQMTRRFVALDEALLVRLAPAMLECIVVASIYWACRRLAAGRGPALVAAAVYGLFAFSGWLPLQVPLSGDTLATSAALVLLVPTVVFTAEALPEGDRPPLVLLFQGMCGLFLVHPFVGLVALVAVAGALLTTRTLGLVSSRRTGRVLSVAIAAAAAGCLPLFVGLAMGRPVLAGALSPDRLFLGLALRPPSVGAPLPTASSLLVAASVAAAVGMVVVAVVRRRIPTCSQARLGLAGGLLAVVPLSLPARFGIPQPVASAEVARVLAPLACLLVALAADEVVGLARRALRKALLRRPSGAHFRSRPRRTVVPVELLVTVVVLAGLLVAALPLRLPVGDRLQPEAAVAQLYRIKRELPPGTWTVVGSPGLLPHVEARGFFIHQEEFLRTYRPESWRYHPDRPELAVPTRDVFVFVRAQRAAGAVPTGIDAVTDVPQQLRAEGEGGPPALRSWIERYRSVRRDVATYHAGGDLTVFRIRRSAQEEREVRAELERERRARR